MVRLAALTAVLLLGLTACGSSGPPPRDRADVLMERCRDLGGAYYEYEATSAGAHIWCIAKGGASIRLDGGE